MTPRKSFALYLFIAKYCKTALATDVERASEMLVCVLAVSDSVASASADGFRYTLQCFYRLGDFK